MTRIVVADDEALVRGGLAAMLGVVDGFEVVGEASNGAEAVQQVLLHRPDIVLMDVRMPVLDGIGATREIVTRAAATRVLMVTTFDLDEYVLEALRAGASGFVLKDTSPERLADAVRLTAAGESLLAPTVTKRLVEHFVQRPSPDVRTRSNLDALTEREMETFRLVAAGLSNAEIARSQYVAEATTKTHVSRILAKLGLRDRVQAVVMAYETGVVTPGDRP